jgi:riboflavin-specific deaminase-like protein
MHRLRALCDAVVVGARTVESHDPQLTTRQVPGPSPTRVVLDPSRRLPSDRKLFQEPDAPTLILVRDRSATGTRLGHAELVGIRSRGELLDVADVVRVLRARGMRRLLIEGGGITVSHFFSAGALTRLQVTVGSVFLGAGRPGLRLPGIDALDAAPRPRTRRIFMGEDVLFDCAFEG